MEVERASEHARPAPMDTMRQRPMGVARCSDVEVSQLGAKAGRSYRRQIKWQCPLEVPAGFVYLGGRKGL